LLIATVVSSAARVVVLIMLGWRGLDHSQTMTDDQFVAVIDN
jgi:hypothetical protein